MPKEGGKGKNRYVRYTRYRRKRKKSSRPSGSTSRSAVQTIRYDEIGEFIRQNGKLSEENERRLLLGKNAWDESLMHFHNPAIPDPTFVFDNSKFLGFFIDMNTWNTVMNLANSPQLVLDKEIFNYYQALSLHEISHYVVCPYDTLTNARLIKAALKHVPERQTPIVVNFFADLHVDMKLFKQKPNIMEEELRQTLKMNQNIGKSKHEKNHSKFYKLLVKCYEIMWNINLNLLNAEFEEITSFAERIKEIIMKDFEDFKNWEKKVTKIARLLKDFLMEEFRPNMGGSITTGTSASDEEFEWGTDLTAGGLDPSNQQMQIPLDVQVMVGNPLEIKTKAKFRSDAEDQRNAEILAGEMNLNDFVKVNRVMRLVPRTQAIATYYRGISKDLIEIKMLQRKPSGAIPVGIEAWRVGDPIEKLDILQTLLVSPKIIPNITTRKWIVKEGPGIEMELSLPDLLLVIDSSGSMEWNPFTKNRNNKSRFHLALVAAFATLHYALKKGAKFAALNFSDNVVVQLWTRDYRKIEKVLLDYQGMGTTLPIRKIKKICQEAIRKSLIILITDFEIFNWEKSYPDILDILMMGNKMVGFFIGGKKSELSNSDFEELASMGAKFYPVKKIEDLMGLVVKEVKEIYEL